MYQIYQFVNHVAKATVIAQSEDEAWAMLVAQLAPKLKDRKLFKVTAYPVESCVVMLARSM